MRRLDRPAEHPAFEAVVEPARKAVQDAIKRKKKPTFPSLWSDFKDAFQQAQLGKCGFCEGQVHGLQYGDVEHFQPKAEVHELEDHPDHWGNEVLWQSTVENRKFKSPTLVTGYWWRAYAWDNYLLSCQICNQQWKKNLYPISGTRATTPACGGETPLLVSPFDGSDPALHFAYGRLGEVWGLSERGRNTIVTCGLDRPSLRLARYKLAKATHELLDEIAGNLTEHEMLRILEYVERDGQPAQPFSGMVQSIFRQRTRMAWEQLGSLIDTLRKSGTPERLLCDCSAPPSDSHQG